MSPQSRKARKMKYLAVLDRTEMIIEANSSYEAQAIAKKRFRTKRTVYVRRIDEERGNASGVQLACENP